MLMNWCREVQNADGEKLPRQKKIEKKNYLSRKRKTPEIRFSRFSCDFLSFPHQGETKIGQIDARKKKSGRESFLFIAKLNQFTTHLRHFFDENLISSSGNSKNFDRRNDPLLIILYHCQRY